MGGGIAETGRLTDVVCGQPCGEVVAVVVNGQVAASADLDDGPAVAVLNPVGGGETEPTVVGAGDDHIADRCLVAVAKVDLPLGIGIVQPVVAGALVEVGDVFAGGGEHDRVEPGCPVGNPSGESILGGLGDIADMHPALMKVEPEGVGVAVTHG
jgi:hypothetical protein